MNEKQKKEIKEARIPNLIKYQAIQSNRSKLLEWITLIFSVDQRKIPIIFQEENTPFYKKLNSLTTIQKERLAIAAEFDGFESRGYLLYRITLTYKIKKDSFFNNKICDIHYINFYKRFIIPYLLEVTNYARNTYCHLQPICYAFQEAGHEAIALYRPSNDSKDEDNLHHHAVIAILPVHQKKMDSICGTNTIPATDRFTGIIKTSEISRIDAGGSIYCTKQLHEHADPLMFAPKKGLPEGDVREISGGHLIDRLFIFNAGASASNEKQINIKAA